MAWELTKWLAVVRVFQLLALFAAGAMNGFLIAMIQINKLGLGRNMVVLELMIVIMLVYTSLALLIQHTSNRSKRVRWLTFFITGDGLGIGVAVAMITILARAGLPSMCLGLTVRFDPKTGDFPDAPRSGYTTDRFSDEAGGRKGELDKYCAFERSIYFIAVGLIFTLMTTKVMSILRICESSYTKNTRVSELLDSLERATEKNQQPPLLMTAPRFMPPPSEGVITRQTSLRSVTTATHAGAAHLNSRPAIPRRPLPHRTSAALVMPSPIDEELEARNDAEDEQYDALVADGMRHEPQRASHQYSSGLITQQETARTHQQLPTTPIPLADDDRSSLADAGRVADGMRYVSDDRHREQQGAYAAVPLTVVPPLDEESAALVSDGSRPMPNLPPYTRRTSTSGPTGAADSSLRVDDYAGAPGRVQDMKSSGYFKQ